MGSGQVQFLIGDTDFQKDTKKRRDEKMNAKEGMRNTEKQNAIFL